MITADDIEYQAPDDADHDWGESYFFPIPLPDEHLLAHVYLVARPALGSMFNHVYVCGGLAQSRSQLLHCNVREHLPAPARWSSVTSPFGLSIEATAPPRDYRIDYSGPAGTEIHVDWQGVMEPFDIHDPQHSPNAGRTQAERTERSSSGDAYRGHFDMTGRVVGTLTVDGNTYQVDALERMDRSWGTRTENVAAMNALNAHFGTSLAFHLRAPRDLNADARQPTSITHGYVYDDGEVFGVTEGEYTLTRLGMAVVGAEVRFRDIRGRSFTLHGMVDVGGPWPAYAGTVTWFGMMKWIFDGDIGHGMLLESNPLDNSIKDHRLRPGHLNTWLQT